MAILNERVIVTDITFDQKFACNSVHTAALSDVVATRIGVLFSVGKTEATGRGVHTTRTGDLRFPGSVSVGDVFVKSGPAYRRPLLGPRKLKWLTAQRT